MNSSEQKQLKVVGKDSYTLTNLFGQRKRWASFTLIGKKRSWMTVGVTNKKIAWNTTKKIQAKNLKQNFRLLPEYSGLANIKFKGEKGFSSSMSETIVFQNRKDQSNFYVIERFFFGDKTSTHYFTGSSSPLNLP